MLLVIPTLCSKVYQNFRINELSWPISKTEKPSPSLNFDFAITSEVVCMDSIVNMHAYSEFTIYFRTVNFLNEFLRLVTQFLPILSLKISISQTTFLRDINRILKHLNLLFSFRRFQILNSNCLQSPFKTVLY